ncbi:MAG: DUF4157 domain-containing protein [Allosphingosinicella sp.]
MLDHAMMRKAAPLRRSSLPPKPAGLCGCKADDVGPGDRGVLPIGLSPKLRVGAVDDPAESDADRIADRIMAMPAGGRDLSAVPVHPRRADPDRPATSGACAGCESEAVRRAASPTGHAASAQEPAGRSASPAIEAAVSRLGGGEPLPAADREFFEPRFGRDFSSVRLHRGVAAEATASAMGARAFTWRTEIGFASGEYRPESPRGRWLMAHELAHVVQGSAGVLRLKCADAPPDCGAGALKKATAASAASTIFSSFVFKAATAKCYRPTDIAASIKETDSGLFDGRLAAYITDAVQPLNGLTAQSTIQPGDCFAFPRGWKDPNIGNVQQEITALNADPAEKNRIIATIYAEQAGASALVDEQRKYIFYAMLLRIQGANWGPTFADVVTPGAFHGGDPANDSYARNFVPAKAYVEGKAADPNKPVNAAVVDRLKGVVETTAATTIPNDAGPYYFHWSLGSNGTVTAEKAYQAALKAGETADVAEKKAAYKQAKDVVHATMAGVTEATGWLRRIRGTNSAPDERIGSMYIYK